MAAKRGTAKRAGKARRVAAPATSPLAGAGEVRSRILGAAFAAFVAHGYAGTSTLEIATRAKVSKRELYAHFGTKQAMLVACIGYGVQRMRVPLALPAAQDRASLITLLAAFGANFLRVLFGPYVVAIYRIAVAEAERSPEVAATLDSAGRGGAREAAAEMLGKAQAAGLIGGADPAEVMSRYFSLLLGDWQLRLLLGVIKPPSEAEIAARAQATATALLTLYPPLRG